MTDIKEHFPFLSMRPSQQTTLDWVQANWGRYDVFVLQAPVAAGKSALALTIGNWANANGLQCSLTTPDNILVRQYVDDFGLARLPRKNQFASGDLFRAAQSDFKSAPLKVMNNYTLLSSRVYSHVQIMDESHELIPMLQDFEGITLWSHLCGLPDNINDAATLMLWAASRNDKTGDKIVKMLGKNPLDYIIHRDETLYRGSLRERLRILPLTPKNNRPILWPPSKVKKLILMSATINKPDIEDLGLHRRRVGYCEVPSDIPVHSRRCVVGPIGSMGQQSVESTWPNMIARIRELHNEYGGRGFVHTTYELARRLEKECPDSAPLIFHNSDNKNMRLNDWINNPNDKRTFIGCGLTTGLNLKGPNHRWQVIMKCMFPDLGDPAVSAKAERKEDWYAWSTIRSVVQAYGRICRGPEDMGTTHILDSDFLQLMNRGKHLMPQWFLDSLDIGI